MNWYKVAQNNSQTIQILSYNYTTNTLKVSFNGGKGYSYKNINPSLFYRIKKLLSVHNFSLVSKILKDKSKQEQLNNLRPETKEEQDLILDDLRNKGIW
jgi:hypothetical protein